MENNHDIDKKFSEASQSADEPETFPSFEKVWEKIEEKLDQKDQKKRVIHVWFPYGIAASLLIGFGALYFTHNKGENSVVQYNSETVIAENKVSDDKNMVAQPEHIQEIDHTIREHIQKRSFEIPLVKHEIPPVVGIYVPVVSEPSLSVSGMPVTVSAPPASDMIIIQRKDSVNVKSIEEVIAMGIKKEKASITSSTSMLSSNNINSVTDTAEVISSVPFDRKDPVIISGYSKAPVRMKTANKNIVAQKFGGRALQNSLDGTASGVMANSVSGNSGNAVTTRGAGSLSADSEPLYIIDGKISDKEGLKNLDLNKIVAITVLKSHAMVAIYGSRAANGVYLVETKDISKKEKKKIKELIKTGTAEKKDNP